MWSMLVACGQPDPGTDAPLDDPPGASAELEQLDLGAPLHPPFDPARTWYSVRASELPDPLVIDLVPADEDARVVTRMEHVDGDDVSGMTPLPDHRLLVEVSSGDGTAERVYVVSLLPDDFPELEVERPGEPSPGWYLLADFDFEQQPEGIGRYLMAVDETGVPGWWRWTPGPSFDLRATAEGGLSWLTAGTATPDLAGFVVDERYRTVSERRAVRVDDFVAVVGDPHEFAVQPDGSAWIVGGALRVEDLSPWGGAAEATVIHNVVQHLDGEGRLLFSWSTVGVVDYGALPAAVWRAAQATGAFEPAHVNAIELDPVDGDLVVSMRIPSRVVKIDLADGALLWSLGGPSSDFVFVGDERERGWRGFSEQHSARRVGADRLLVFDNGTSADLGRVGTARMAEYQLDERAWTATLVAEYALPDADVTPAGGSVQRLEDGHTVIGWGSLQVAAGGKAPALTELDADGAVVFELTLPENLWTYRVWKAEGDPLTGSW